jgi:hypothetical protein
LAAFSENSGITTVYFNLNTASITREKDEIAAIRRLK